MHVVIIGAGRVGSYLARILIADRYEVAIIEADAARAHRLQSSLDALVVHGSGVSTDALQLAGIDQADLLIAVTPIDEVNLIACMTGRKHGPPGLRSIARVHQPKSLTRQSPLSAADLGLDALASPEHAVAEAAADALRYPGSGEMRELAAGRLALVGMALGADSPLVHGTLADLRKDFPGEFLVIAVDGLMGMRIPGGRDHLASDDRPFVLTLPGNLTELAILSGRPWHHIHRVLIVGCGNTGLALARDLEAGGLSPVVLEQDRGRAELLSGMLPRSLVIHGDGSDPTSLRYRIREQEIDAVVVLLAAAEKSVLTGLLARSLGVRKVVIRCDDEEYARLAHRLGIDAALSPKRLMADMILKYLRKDSIESTILLGENEVEVVHMRVPDAPRRPGLVGRPIQTIRFPDGTLVCAVIRGEETIIGTGSTHLRPGDELLVSCRPETLPKLERLVS